MRSARLRILGAGIVVAVAVLPAITGGTEGSSDATRLAHRATSVTREAAATIDAAGTQATRSAALALRRVDTPGTVAAPLALLLAGSIAIAAAMRRRRPPDPVTARAPARAPPVGTTFAVAR